MSTLNQVPGRKVGMTQIFDDARKAVPVTVIECGSWIVTQVKTVENDGYAAIQVGSLKKRYQDAGFHPQMLKKKEQFFADVRELRVEDTGDTKVGEKLTLENVAFDEKTMVNVTGKSSGKGFQGVVKRWGFAGGGASHGAKFGRRPGSIGNMASQGKVIKGKKLPGHQGNRTVTVQGLRIVKVDKERGVLLVKGAVPGRKNSLVHLCKQG